MPRKADPAVGILRYFEDAPIDAALMLFGLVRDVVKRRTPAAPKKRTRRSATTTTIAAGIDPTRATPPHDPTLRTAGGTPKPPRTRKLKDVPLPGLPGPVSTVGD